MTKTHKMIAVDYKNLAQELPIFLATDLTNWEYIDDRYNSFYGSTFYVPAGDYKVDESFTDKILIIGDKYLIEDTYTYNTNYITDIYSTDIPVNKTREYKYRNFETVLKKVYPNAEIIREEAHNFDDIVNYFMNNMDNYPNYVIFNGAENTYLQTKDYNDVVNRLTILNSIFQPNDIKALLIYTPNYDIMSIDDSDYLNIFSHQYTNIEIFDLYRWLENHFELDNTLTWKNLQNKIETICDKYNPCISEDGYSIVIHNRIKKAVIEDFFNIHRKHFYISFQYTKVKDDTYYNSVQWKRGSYEASIFGRKYTGTNSDSMGLNNELDEFHTIHTPKDVQIHFITKYGTDNHWNLFSNTGEFIAVATHTSYAEDKYMCQQLQVNCNEEYMYSRGDYLNLMQIRKYATGAITSEIRSIYPPMFPATGCPWLCVSDDNIENYGVQLYRTVNISTNKLIKKSVNSNTKNYKLEKYLPRYCYITQTDKSVIISIELKDCNGKRPTLYESASVGMVEDLQTENYPLPLYACGGSQAIKQDIYVYTPITGGCRIYLTGNVYDLSADNICLSNSNATHPTKFYNSNSSTFKVLSPEGKWYNIFNLAQSAHIKPKDTCAGCIPDFKCVLDYPYEYMENNYYPMVYQKKHTSTFDEMKKEEPYMYEPKKHNTKIDELSIYLDNSEIVGSIPNHYISYDESLPCGEIFLDNKRYLCMPNIWDMRLWWYVWVYGFENEKWTQEYVRNRFDKIFMPKRYEKINDKLLIRLED